MNSTVSELVAAAEEVCMVPCLDAIYLPLQILQCVSDVKALTSTGEHLILATGRASQFLTIFFVDDHPIAILNCIRALGGYTHADSVQTVFDTDTFVESKYLEKIHESSGNLSLSLNWYIPFCILFVLTLNMHHLRYDSFKVCTNYRTSRRPRR